MLMASSSVTGASCSAPGRNPAPRSPLFSHHNSVTRTLGFADRQAAPVSTRENASSTPTQFVVRRRSWGVQAQRIGRWFLALRSRAHTPPKHACLAPATVRTQPLRRGRGLNGEKGGSEGTGIPAASQSRRGFCDSPKTWAQKDQGNDCKAQGLTRWHVANLVRPHHRGGGTHRKAEPHWRN